MEHNDECAPLLPQSEFEASRFQREPNPLPWSQLSIMLFAQVCEQLALQSIQPYINQVRTRPRLRRTQNSGLLFDLRLYPAGWGAGHHWRRQAESRVLRWADRESMLHTHFGGWRAQQQL